MGLIPAWLEWNGNWNWICQHWHWLWWLSLSQCMACLATAFVRLHLNNMVQENRESSGQFRSAYSLHNGQLWLGWKVHSLPNLTTCNDRTQATLWRMEDGDTHRSTALIDFRIDSGIVSSILEPKPSNQRHMSPWKVYLCRYISPKWVSEWVGHNGDM